MADNKKSQKLKNRRNACPYLKLDIGHNSKSTLADVSETETTVGVNKYFQSDKSKKEKSTKIKRDTTHNQDQNSPAENIENPIKILSRVDFDSRNYITLNKYYATCVLHMKQIYKPKAREEISEFTEKYAIRSVSIDPSNITKLIACLVQASVHTESNAVEGSGLISDLKKRIQGSLFLTTSFFNKQWFTHLRVYKEIDNDVADPIFANPDIKFVPTRQGVVYTNTQVQDLINALDQMQNFYLKYESERRSNPLVDYSDSE